MFGAVGTVAGGKSLEGTGGTGVKSGPRGVPTPFDPGVEPVATVGDGPDELPGPTDVVAPVPPSADRWPVVAPPCPPD